MRDILYPRGKPQEALPGDDPAVSGPLTETAEEANFLDQQGFKAYIAAIETTREARLRRSPSALAVILFLVPATLWGAEDAGLSLSSILTGAAGRRLDPQALQEGAGAAVAAVAGAETLPIGCATSLVQAMGRSEPLPSSLRQAYATIAGRPSLEAARAVVTRDGEFTIHFAESSRSFGLRPSDRDRNGVPDPVDRFAEALVASRSVMVSRLGYPPPMAEDQRLDVYLLELGHGLEGYTVAATDGAPGAAGSRFIVLDADLPTDRVLPAVAHQVAHACLMSLGARTAAWWSEASASFLTYAATGDLKGAEAGVKARLQSPGKGLASDDLLLMQGSLLWPLFLSERSGDPAIVRQIWGEIAAQGIDPLAAADLVLSRSQGLSLAQAYREYVVWNLFTGPRDDGRHYSIGRSLPESTVSPLGPALPLDLDPVEPLEPLGSVTFRLPGDPRRGALDLAVRAEGGAPAADLLVSYASEERGPVLVPVSLDASGNGRVSLPWADAQQVWVMLRNASSNAGENARFEVHGAHDPFAPYDLASLTAEGIGSSLVLQWTTASEKGLVGWNVYRSESPAGPFSRLNGVAVPAYGDGGADTGYVFVDDGARPGRRYYYLLEGYTDLGLAQRSQMVSGKVLSQR